MKKTLCGLLIIGSSLFSSDPQLVAPAIAIGAMITKKSDDLKPIDNSPFEMKKETQSGFSYVRFTAGEGDLSRVGSFLPGFGLGYRRLAGDGAADISISGIGYLERSDKRSYWSIPKASCLKYYQPEEQQSFYAGGGLAWGGVSTDNNDFVGIIPSVTCGYEFMRKGTVLSFTEVSLSQPAFAIYNRGKFPGPILEGSVGIGF
jgi:hypothetical protein